MPEAALDTEAGLALPRKAVGPAVCLRAVVVGGVPHQSQPAEPECQVEVVCQAEGGSQGCLALRGLRLARCHAPEAPWPVP